MPEAAIATNADRCCRHHVPDWVTDKKGQHTQEKIWEGVVQKLEQVQPACVSNLP
jgi:hypothetical protein